MSRIAYVDGRYVPHRAAAVHVEDRGYQFADGVYEVIAVSGGRLVDEEPHLDRLNRSLRELRIPWPMSRRAMKIVMREVLRRNRVGDGIIYLQVTRGVAPRDHAFPAKTMPSLVMTARHARPQGSRALRQGVGVVTLPDIRWKRCDIKSVSLLPNVLAKQAAKDAGAYEAWLVDGEGFVTEGTSTNAWIVTRDNKLITRRPDQAILNGITRLSLLRMAERSGVEFVQRAFTVNEALAAREAFVTSTTSLVLPVIRIDGHLVGDGKPGPVTRDLQAAYNAHMAGRRARRQRVPA